MSRNGSRSDLPAAGEAVGGFLIESELARGGMGVVFRARDPQSKRPVALKLALRQISERAARRFQVEAQASAKLRHPCALRQGPWSHLDELLAWEPARVKVREKQWGQALCLFLRAGEQLSKQGRTVSLASAWLGSGHFDEALKLLPRIERARPGDSQGLAGFAAYRARERERAQELWGGDENLDAWGGGYFVRLRAGLERLR